MEKVGALIIQKKELLKNSKDIQEADKLLAELEGLEWLRAQITVVFNIDNAEAVEYNRICTAAAALAEKD